MHVHRDRLVKNRLPMDGQTINCLHTDWRQCLKRAAAKDCDDVVAHTRQALSGDYLCPCACANLRCFTFSPGKIPLEG